MKVQLTRQIQQTVIPLLTNQLSSRFFSLRLKIFKLVTDLILLSNEFHSNGPAIRMV